MLIEGINKGPVVYCGSNDKNNSIWVSLSDIIFSVMLQIYIVCGACGLRSPSNESRCYILHIYLIRTGIDNARNATKITKVLLSI